jgi:subtilisin family serine protease
MGFVYETRPRMFRFLAPIILLTATASAAWPQPATGRVIVEWEDRSISLLQPDPPPANLSTWMEAFQKQPGVKAAQWDYPLEFYALPDDPLYNGQWSLPHIGADQVWDITTGGLTALGDTIVIAILDGGFDIEHPDLAGNLWTNRGEIPGDGIDNDGNGFIDDVYGWNFADDSPSHPADYHGTSVAGIAGAVGNNNRGLTGLNWNVKMLLCTTKTVSDVVEAYQYIIHQRELYAASGGVQGAFIVATNASFGLSEVFCEEQPVWAGMYDKLGAAGILTAAAASNNGLDADQAGDMPVTCASPFLITALNSNKNDAKEPGSGYGPVSIDMGAPGSDIPTTQPNNKYGNFNGSSAAAPHVCGAIALLYSIPCETFAQSMKKAPQQAALTVRRALLDGVSPSPGLEGLTLTGGRLSVINSLEIMEAECEQEEQNVLKILDIFPNPAREGIEVAYNAHDQKRISWRLIHFTGQCILQQALPVSNSLSNKRFYLSLPNLPQGLYLLVLTDGQTQVSKPFFIL